MFLGPLSSEALAPPTAVRFAGRGPVHQFQGDPTTALCFTEACLPDDGSPMPK